MKKIPVVGWASNTTRTSHEVKTIYDLLDVIRMKPGLFIGRASITALQHFIGGFEAGLDAVDNAFESESPSFGDFHDWIARRLGYRYSSLGWPAMILEKSGGEAEAYERFFVELDAFRKTAE